MDKELNRHPELETPLDNSPERFLDGDMVVPVTPSERVKREVNKNIEDRTSLIGDPKPVIEGERIIEQEVSTPQMRAVEKGFATDDADMIKGAGADPADVMNEFLSVLEQNDSE